MGQVTLQLDLTKDTASIAIRRLIFVLASAALRRHVGGVVTVYTQSYLRSLAGNKNGWPSQRFYDKAARGTVYDVTAEGILMSIDNEEAPGAMRHQYNRGVPGRTTIPAKDKLLAIPARAEFYGHRPGEFDNLKFIMFANGTKALIIGKGGAQLVNFSTGKGSSKGIGQRSAMMVAYWLKDKVTQDAKPEILPSKAQYLALIQTALQDGIEQLTHMRN